MRVILTLATCLIIVSGAHAQEDAEDDPLAELAELAGTMVDTGPEGGGSIRAKRDADLTRSTRLKDPSNIEARVESVVAKGFPIVAVAIKVTKPAKQGGGKTIKKNTKLVVTPRYKVNEKRVALEDAATVINAGSYYLQKGDKVVLRLGAEKSGYWEAEYIERK